MKKIISNGMIISNENGDIDEGEYRWSNLAVNADFTFINEEGITCCVDLAQIVQDDEKDYCRYYLFVYEKETEEQIKNNETNSTVDFPVEEIFNDKDLINEIQQAMLELSKDQYGY